MRYATRLTLATGLVGVVAFAGAAVAETEGDVERAPIPLFFEAGGPGFHERGRLVHGERTMIDDDGNVTTMIDDAGTVTAASDAAVTIERADGESMTIRSDEDTRIHRNGEAADLGDFEAGDFLHVFQARDADGTRVVAILGHSDDWEPPMFRHRIGRRPGFRPFGEVAPADPAAANEEAIFLG